MKSRFTNREKQRSGDFNDLSRKAPFKEASNDMKNVLQDIDANRNAWFDFFANQQESLER